MPEPENSAMNAATQADLDEIADLHDHELVNHLVDYKRLDPESEIAHHCEELREIFKMAGHFLVNKAKRSPDRTVAIRKIHDAAMSSIAALVLNAD